MVVGACDANASGIKLYTSTAVLVEDNGAWGICGGIFGKSSNALGSNGSVASQVRAI
jgi:hypothetical protein